MEPHKWKDPADKTMQSCKSNAESGTAEASDGDSGAGACGLQGSLQLGWLGCPLCSTLLGMRGLTAGVGQGM